MDLWNGAIGLSNHNGYISPDYTVLIPKSNINVEFFSMLFKTEKMLKLFSIHSQGVYKRLRFNNLSKIKMFIPCLEEQNKIVSFFKLIDQQISVEKEKLESMKLLKKGLLQQILN